MRNEVVSKQLRLRLATREDIDILYNWTNDPIIWEKLFDNNPISYETYLKWFEKIMSAKDIIQFILTYDNIPMGQARLSIEDDKALIGYSISEDYHGMGYEKNICQLLINKVKVEYPHIKKLVAQVESQNVASAYYFQKCGFYKNIEQYELDIEAIEFFDVTTSNQKLGGVLYLTNNNNAIHLFEWISRRVNAKIYSEKLTVNLLERIRPKLVLSYNYSYKVSKECIDYMNRNIINMHISYLPYNKGASPNIWSFLEDTPKGVTIHQMSEGLDEGDIIFQKELYFDENQETFQTTHYKLNEEIVEMCKEHWDELYSGNYTVRKQENRGTMHNLKDLEKIREKICFAWDETISDVKKRYKNSIED